MKELWATIITTYTEFRGTGKGLALFLVSVLIICLLNTEEEKEEGGRRINPLLFILSPLAGIGYAFSAAYKRYRARSVPAAVLTGLIIMVTLILAGGWVFSEADHYRTENTIHIKQAYRDVMDRLLESEEGTIRVMASRELAPYMKAYSGRFDLMYAYPRGGDPSSLKGRAGYVYEQMGLSEPDQGRLVSALRDAGYDHIVYNTQKTYFGLPFEEFDYELVADVGDYRIYKDRTPSGAPASSSVPGRIWAFMTFAACILFIVCDRILVLRSVKKGKEEGPVRAGSPLAIPVIILIVCQIAGVLFLSYDRPAALPTGIYSGWLLTFVYTVLPLLMIPLYYSVYMGLAKRLFDEDGPAWFMALIICMLNLWGYQSDRLLPFTMLYSWFSIGCIIIHGVLPALLILILDKYKAGDFEKKETTQESDYYMWEEEEMKNHKIINSRNLAIALIIVVIMFIGSVFVMNRKINSLYETTVNLQQQVEELKQSE
ncbi:MAG: hypothetical protein K5857_00165 [Lachnospiraceae bacterium]|nr:hypothetical protein [Lachnospiraceae bacterium]